MSDDMKTFDELTPVELEEFVEYVQQKAAEYPRIRGGLSVAGSFNVYRGIAVGIRDEAYRVAVEKLKRDRDREWESR